MLHMKVKYTIMLKFKAISVETGKEVCGNGVCQSCETNLFDKTFKEGEVSYLFKDGLMNGLTTWNSVIVVNLILYILTVLK